MNSFTFGTYEEERHNDNYPNIFIYQPTNILCPNQNFNINDFELLYENQSNNKCKETNANINKEDYSKKIKKKKINSKLNDSNRINCNIINVPKNEEIKNERKKCGRKKKRSEEKGTHTKFSDDNMRRKCKHLILKNILIFINDKIKEEYKGKIGNGLFKKELQTLNQTQKSNATINFNQTFLSKTVGEIFSDNISGRFTNFPVNHNKLLIEKLRNEKDEDKKIYFNKIFNITFRQCLQHFRGEYYLKELEGLKCFNDIKDDILKQCDEDGEEYIESLDYYLKNFEEIINNKRPRKSRKSN